MRKNFRADLFQPLAVVFVHQFGKARTGFETLFGFFSGGKKVSYYRFRTVTYGSRPVNLHRIFGL